MNDQHPSAQAHTSSDDRVIIVGAGPVGCTAALLLADQGVPVTLLERHPQPHPLPRAVHLDDEVARTLYRAGVSEEFLARSRSCSGLRLLDAGHRVMAEFRRQHEIGIHGFPQANMFHQPDLEGLLFARAGRHPLIDFHRGAEVTGMDGTFGPLTGGPVEVHAELAPDGSGQTFTGRLVLGCDGASSTIRDLSGITMEDLGFTERWLVIDIRSEKLLDTWDGVEQICDPARAATFMQVTGHRYRWEFQLHDGDDEAGMITPDALGRLLEPWTRRRDLDGLEITRSATYTFRARLASCFQAGRIFLLGDAAHLTPPFIGQGLAAGLRDADNLAWKIAHVLTGQAGEDLLATYDTERRPHARAMIKKAIRIGWAMTGGQDRAAAVRRIALAAAVRSDRACEAIASTATPRLKTGALQQRPPLLRSRTPATVRPGGLIANPLVSIRAGVPTGDGTSAGEGAPVRLDSVLRGRTAVLTAGQPSAELVDLCRRHRLLLVKVSDTAGSAPGAAAGAPAAGGWAEVCLDDGGGAACFQALTRGPGLTIIVRPDRVIAAVATRGRLPRLPWSVPAAPVPRASQMIPVPRRNQPPVPATQRRLTMFTALSLLLAAACLLPGSAKLLGHPKMQKSAAHFGIPWRHYRLIGVAELAAGAGVLIGLWWHPLGVAAAAGMVLLLIGALITHRRAVDSAKEMAPALFAITITLAYLAIALTS